MSLIIRWAASAIALFLVTKLVGGVYVDGIMATIIAALAIGLVNATLGSLIKLLTLPIGCLTLGISGIVINALMFWVASAIVPSFHVNGFIPALLGSIAMSLVGAAVNFLLQQVFTSDNKEK
ncbi:MAG: phage holin family protein [Acidobacteria bacterium]|nr:phage holin family protein [Acidobacteriota bacterium]